MADLLVKRKWQILLSIPIALYFFYSIVFLCPDSLWRTRLVSGVSLFWNYWRLDQNWALFSPAIRDINYHTAAIITFQDGTRTVWELPRMNKLCLETTYNDEKWRKWAGDSVPWPNYKQFWPDLARYIGRKFYNHDNQPTAMVLCLYSVKIPPPTVNQPQSQLPYHTEYSYIFSYRYTPEDFQ
jgi:hypothetical protein